jgi:hypothetical protein
MSKIILTFAVFSAGLYLLLVIASFMGHPPNKKDISDPATELPPSYFWGLMYAALFYYGFPVWLVRYGLENTCKLVFLCILVVAAVQAVFRQSGLIEADGFGESLAYSLLISVPVRAAAGLWVAKNDRRWRQSILNKRKAAKGRGIDKA